MHRLISLKLVRSLLRTGLVVASAAASSAQQPPGSPATIALESPPAIVDTSFDARGQAEIDLSGTTAYGLRLESASDGTQTSLICTAEPIVLKELLWNRVTGACRILIAARSAADGAVRVVRLNISRAPYPASGQSPAGEALPRDVEIHVKPSKTGAPAAVRSWTFAAGRFWVVIFAVAAGTLLAILGAIVLLSIRRRPAAQPDSDPVDDGSGDDGSEFSQPPANAASTGALNDVLKRLQELEAKLDAVQKARSKQTDSVFTGAVEEMGRSATMLRDEARRLGATVSEKMEQLRRVAGDLDALSKVQQGKLSLLLASLPEAAALRGAPGTAAAMARFDETVRQCVRETPSLKGELEPMARTLDTAGASLDSLLEAAGKLQNQGLTDRLAEVRGELRDLSREVEAALAGGDDRACLYFRLDLSRLSGTQQNLSDELANCLGKQVFRLENPVGYFGMRFELTIGQALQEVIDCSDSLLDPYRRIDAIQKPIAAFVAEAEAALIDPKPGTPLLDNEHVVFGVVASGNPADKPDHISALRVRGLKRRGQVLRKASVMIFS